MKFLENLRSFEARDKSIVKVPFAENLLHYLAAKLHSNRTFVGFLANFCKFFLLMPAVCFKINYPILGKVAFEYGVVGFVGKVFKMLARAAKTADVCFKIIT